MFLSVNIMLAPSNRGCHKGDGLPFIILSSFYHKCFEPIGKTMRNLLMKKNSSLVLLSAALVLISGCQSISATSIQMPSETPLPAVSPSPEKVEAMFQRATPHAQQPAAGICAEAPGEKVVVAEIFADVPSPRCLRVWPDQHLQVINRTDETVGINLGFYTNRLQPGESLTLDQPFNKFLEPGVHRLLVSPSSGPEIWLVE